MPLLSWTDEDVFLVADRAYHLHEQGCYSQAATLFEGLLVIDPGNRYCRDGLTAGYLALGRAQDAVHIATLSLEADSNDFFARARRVEGYLQAGQIEAARRDFDMLRAAGQVQRFGALSLRVAAAIGQLQPASRID